MAVDADRSNLGRLDPGRLSKLDWNGKLISGDAPSKESFLHLAMYQERERNQAVIHLHATHSVAVSVLEGLDPDDLLPPLTAYYVMRIGTLPLVPYYAPGDMALADAVRGYAGRHHALLLANHGPVVAGASLAAAADAVEELEATAKLYLLLLWPAYPPADLCPGRRHQAPLSRGLVPGSTKLEVPTPHCFRHTLPSPPSGAFPREGVSAHPSTRPPTGFPSP